MLRYNYSYTAFRCKKQNNYNNRMTADKHEKVCKGWSQPHDVKCSIRNMCHCHLLYPHHVSMAAVCTAKTARVTHSGADPGFMTRGVQIRSEARRRDSDVFRILERGPIPSSPFPFYLLPCRPQPSLSLPQSSPIPALPLDPARRSGGAL